MSSDSSLREPAELLASSGFLLARIGGESTRRFTRALADHGLRISHYGVLMTLASEGPLSQTALGARIGMDPRNLVGVLDFLEQQGLVNRDKDSRDRRRHGVQLTSRGAGMLAKLRRVGAVLEKKMLSPLDASERMILHRLLMKLLAGVEG